MRCGALDGKLRPAEKNAGAAASGNLRRGRRSRWLRGQCLGRFSKRVSWFRRLLNQIWVWELAGVVLCRYSGGGDRDAVGVMGTTAGPRACSCGSDPCLTVRFVVVLPGELVV